ncbi:hypothetical protein M8J75_011624 [Diaphorina citri]|nr:hypothetical protein M8J75_011624 [Diaphorina citri]
MFLWIFLLALTQLSRAHPNHFHTYPNTNSISHKYVPSAKGPHPYLASPSAIEKPDIYTQSGNNYVDYLGDKVIGNTYAYSTVTQQERIIPSTIPRTVLPGRTNGGFSSGVGTVVTEVPLPQEVITKPNFVLQPQTETIQKPDFVVQENVLGVIQKPEFLIQEISEVVSKPEFLVQEEIVGTVVKPTFVVEEQVSVVQKPEFAIQENVEVIVKPEFQIEEVTEVIPRPTFVVEENVVPIQKPTFVIQSSQEVIQKPDIVISPVPVTVRKPEYQITENIIPVAKPAFFVQETQETVVKPEFVITEEVVPVPRPNFLVQEEVQVVQKPNFLVQDVVQTVQRPEYSVQESQVIVQKPEYFVEDVTETVIRPTFVEQEVAETVVSPRFVVEEQLIPVSRPQFVVAETVVPVVKPEFFIEEVSEVIPKPEYLVEDVPVTVEKPTYLLEETPVVIQKPNYVIEENVETVSKPEFFIQEEVEVITKPQFFVQDDIIETIVKPKFVVISSSNPAGEEFDISKYNLKSSASVVNNPAKVVVVDTPARPTIAPLGNPKQIPIVVGPGVQSNNVPQYIEVAVDRVKPATLTRTEPVVIPPSVQPRIIDVIEEFSHPAPRVVSQLPYSTPVHTHSGPVIIPQSIQPQTIEVVEELPNPIFRSSTHSIPHHHAGPFDAHHSVTHNHAPVVVNTDGLEIVEVTHPHPVKSHGHRSPLSSSTLVGNGYKRDHHGRVVIASKSGYQSEESNEFLPPKIKVKKNVDQSQAEELFETLYGFHGLVEDDEHYFDDGMPHPKNEYFFDAVQDDSKSAQFASESDSDYLSYEE